MLNSVVFQQHSNKSPFKPKLLSFCFLDRNCIQVTALQTLEEKSVKELISSYSHDNSEGVSRTTNFFKNFFPTLFVFLLKYLQMK